MSLTPIQLPATSIDNADLSNDQNYLLEMYDAVLRGVLSDDLGKRSPGSLNHARWLTTSKRKLRLYVSINKPSRNLMRLAEFVMMVYIPTWFEIKGDPYVQMDARYLY